MTDNKLRLTMLGTGNAAVTKCYNTCFALREENQCFLVDAGGGNQILRILQDQEIPLTQIHDLFITHAHSDHILGAVWIIRMIGQLINRGKYQGTLNIYANKEVAENLKTICKIVLMEKITRLFDDKMQWRFLEDGNSHTILGREVSFFDIRSTKLLQYGFQIRQEGVFFCGDEPLNEAFYQKARNAQYLLHEAFCLYSERELFKPYEKHHSTVKDACSLAEKLHVKNLLLMHTEDSHIEERKRLYLEEGKTCFSGNLLIPDDGESITIRH